MSGIHRLGTGHLCSRQGKQVKLISQWEFNIFLAVWVIFLPILAGFGKQNKRLGQPLCYKLGSYWCRLPARQILQDQCNAGSVCLWWSCYVCLVESVGDSVSGFKLFDDRGMGMYLGKEGNKGVLVRESYSEKIKLKAPIYTNNIKYCTNKHR